MNLKTPQRLTFKQGAIEISYLQWHSPLNDPQPSVILLHGLADSAMVWSSLGNYLTSAYRVIAINLRGHGDSSKP